MLNYITDNFMANTAADNKIAFAFGLPNNGFQIPTREDLKHAFTHSECGVTVAAEEQRHIELRVDWRHIKDGKLVLAGIKDSNGTKMMVNLFDQVLVSISIEYNDISAVCLTVNVDSSLSYDFDELCKLVTGVYRTKGLFDLLGVLEMALALATTMSRRMTF